MPERLIPMMSRLKQILPRPVKARLSRLKFFSRLLRAGFGDVTRYYRHAVPAFAGHNTRQLESLIIATTHVIEKGLSHHEMRAGFGQTRITELVQLIERYLQSGGSRDCWSIQSAITVLAAYREVHRANGALPDSVTAAIDGVSDSSPCNEGYLQVTREDITAGGQGAFSVLSATRYSIRDFDATPVDIGKINEAVDLARKTPSVCNRQCWRVHVVSDASHRTAMAALHNGCRGFGDRAGALLVVASDLQVFSGTKERNEGYVDGGLFSMSLLYALHYQGFGACALNWCMDRKSDRALRTLLNISDAEVIIMLIAVGNLPETLRVAKSERRPLEDIISYV